MNNAATDLDGATEAHIVNDLSDEALEAAASGDGQRAITWAYCTVLGPAGRFESANRERAAGIAVPSSNSLRC